MSDWIPFMILVGSLGFVALLGRRQENKVISESRPLPPNSGPYEAKRRVDQ